MQQEQGDKIGANVPDNLHASQRYLGMLKAIPRSNSMPGHTTMQGAQPPVAMVRASSRASSRGRCCTSVTVFTHKRHVLCVHNLYLCVFVPVHDIGIICTLLTLLVC